MHKKLGKKKIRIKELCRVPGTPAALDTYLFLIDYAACTRYYSGGGGGCGSEEVNLS
jgi:hypothetical protein